METGSERNMYAVDADISIQKCWFPECYADLVVLLLSESLISELKWKMTRELAFSERRATVEAPYCISFSTSSL